MNIHDLVGQCKMLQYDCVIIGAGISGCYLAYRLSQLRPNMNILIVEKSSRVGGRLMSQSNTRDPRGIALDYGAMRYFPSLKRTAALVHELGLTPIKYTFVSSDNYLYLRGVRYQYKNLFPDVYDLYGVPLHERDGTPSEQLYRYFSSEDIIEPDLQAVIGQTRFSSQFMDLYWDLSDYNYMVSQQAVGTWLFDESLLTSESHLMIQDGHEQLCHACLERTDAEVMVNAHARQTSHKTVDIYRDDTVVMTVTAPLIVYTGQIIDYELYSSLYDGLRSVHMISRRLQPISGCKIYLEYEDAWWDTHDIPHGRHITDMTMNQFWVGWSEKTCFIYAAALNTIAWYSLIPEDLRNNMYDDHSPLIYDVEAYRDKFAPLLDEVHTQVSLLFGLNIEMPVKSISFKFWFAMYEYWKPSGTIRQDQEFLESMNMINADYSDYQGWVEGALERVDSFITTLQL